MKSGFSKVGIIVVVLVVLLGGVVAFVALRPKAAPEPAPVVTETPKKPEPLVVTVGTSVEGRKIKSYTYGTGSKELVFVGGIHGGYEWNSVLLAYQFMDYLDLNSEVIPLNVRVTIIPSANPDAVFKVVGKEGRFEAEDVSTDKALLASARFNANTVDLNRNFACNWRSKGTWQGKTVSAGTRAFSEPESQVIKDIAEKNKPVAFVFWHSQANAVYASECNDGILPETLDIMNAYAKASAYPAVKSFDSYAVTGDAEGWLASIKIPAITVELKTHETIEWDKNVAGVKALFEYYRKK